VSEKERANKANEELKAKQIAAVKQAKREQGKKQTSK